MKNHWDIVAFVLVMVLFAGWIDWIDYKREMSGCTQKEQHDDR